MNCKYAKNYDEETSRYDCSISGDECIYLLPNENNCEDALYLKEIQSERSWKDDE